MSSHLWLNISCYWSLADRSEHPLYYYPTFDWKWSWHRGNKILQCSCESDQSCMLSYFSVDWLQSAVFSPTCHIITCCSSLIMQIGAVLSLPVAPSSAVHIFFMIFIVENWATALFDMKHDVLICYLLSPWQLCDQWCWLFFSCCCFFFPICCAALELVFLNVFV